MKIIVKISSLFIFFALNGFSQEQKVTVKKDLVSVNDTPAFILVSTNYPDAYTLYNLSNQKLAVFNAQFYTDSRATTSGSSENRIGYFEITFLNKEMDKCEIRIVGFKKQLAQLIVSESLVENGELNEMNVKQFCGIHGMKFSEDRKRSETTIIINH